MIFSLFTLLLKFKLPFFSFDKLSSIYPYQILSLGLQDSIALTIPSVNVQDFARYSTGSEQWIRPMAPRGNGCDNILELRHHYEGKGNQSRRIASANKYRETLHYKSERAMPWETFLDQMQKMFNIYKEEGKEMMENTKLWELFKRTKHTQLTESVKALEVRYNMDGLTYTQAANHLTAAISKLPDCQMAHQVSNVKTAGAGGNKQGHVHRNGNSIYATDGTIWTGLYDEWATMNDVDKEKVTAERECKKKARSGKGSKGKTYRRKVSDLTSLTEDI